jgi:hypothetical protein
LIADLPVKSKKQAVKRRWFYYIVPEFENKLGLNQRVAKIFGIASFNSP